MDSKTGETEGEEAEGKRGGAQVQTEYQNQVPNVLLPRAAKPFTLHTDVVTYNVYTKTVTQLKG